MSRHAPSESTWRPLATAERALVELWVAAWNSSTSDTARAGSGLSSRTSCTCGSCDTFDVKGLELGMAPPGTQLLDVGGTGWDSSGAWVANLTVIKSDATVSFEVHPVADVEISLPDLRFEMHVM